MGVWTLWNDRLARASLTERMEPVAAPHAARPSSTRRISTWNDARSIWGAEQAPRPDRRVAALRDHLNEALLEVMCKWTTAADTSLGDVHRTGPKQ